MPANLYGEGDLGSASSSFRYTWPKQLLHGSSPLARQERPPTCSQTHSASPPQQQQQQQQPSKLPHFHEIFEAAAEPPPPYTELPRVPYASFYALAYNRSFNFQHHVVPVSLSETTTTKDVELDIEDDIEQIGQLAVDMTCDMMELDTPSPTTTTSSRRSNVLGPWCTPSQKPRRYLLRRRSSPTGQRALECLRTNFILEHVPHLANGLRQFEDHASTPVADVFYDWYNVLSVDQRVRYMPWFVPERLDLVRLTPPPPTTTTTTSTKIPAAGEKLSSPLRKEKIASSDMSPDSKSAGVDVAAALERATKRKESRCPTPPPSFASAQGWDELDVAIRLLRILPNRQPSKQLRKEALIRGWKSSIAELGLAQWDHQLAKCSGWRDARLELVEKEWRLQMVPFSGYKYSAAIFPSSWRRRRVGEQQTTTTLSSSS